MADVQYTTLYLPDGTGVSVIVGSQLYLTHLAAGATTSPPVFGTTTSTSPAAPDVRTPVATVWFHTPFGPQPITAPDIIDEYRRRDYAELTAAQAAAFYASGAEIPDVTYVTGVELPAAMATVAAGNNAFATAQRAAFVPFWAAGETVGAGAVRMTALGLTIKRIDAGTTRGSYDATEAALWTVTSGGGGGGGSATTDASQLTSGILPSARIGDGSITAAKVAADVATQAELDAASTADRARANHTGTQAISTVTGLQAALDAKSAAIEAVNTVAASGTAVTLPDVTVASIHDITLTGNCTLTFPTATAGKSLMVRLTQDATGSRTVTWPATVKWPGGTAPTLSTAAAKQDVISFVSIGGSNWSGFVAGLDVR